MRHSALLNAFGALGQRTERRFKSRSADHYTQYEVLWLTKPETFSLQRYRWLCSCSLEWALEKALPHMVLRDSERDFTPEACKVRVPKFSRRRSGPIVGSHGGRQRGRLATKPNNRPRASCFRNTAFPLASQP